MESKILSFFAALFTKVSQWFDESVCGKLYKKICTACYRTFESSTVGKWFCACSGMSSVFSESIVGKIVSIPQKILLFLRGKLCVPLNRIVKNSAVCHGVNRWADISIRFYGVVVTVLSVLLLLFRPSGKIGMLLILAALICGVFMILINRSLRQLFGGSKILQLFSGLFVERTGREYDCAPCTKQRAFIGICSGIVLAFLCMAFGPEIFIVCTFGTLAFVFLLKYLRLGVFLTIVFSPMLPTMVLVGLSFLCALVFCIHFVTDETFVFAKNSFNTFVIFFVLALLWGVVNSFAVTKSLSQVAVHISFILFYFVIINTICTREQWILMIRLFLLSAFVVAAYGVLQNFIGVNSAENWLDEEMFSDIEQRVISFFNNPNVLGEFLVMTIPVMLATIWGIKKENHKAVYTCAFLAMAACMIFTWSRGAWLGVVFASILFFVIMDSRWLFAGFMALLVLPLLLIATGNTAILERLISIGNTADTSTAYRVAIWGSALDMIRDFWIPGIGIGTDAFYVVYPAYAAIGADFALHTHNLYLQIWVEMGIIGIGSFFAMIFMLVRQTFSYVVVSARKKDPVSKIVIALGAGILGFLLQGMTDYVWYNYKMLMIFWIVIGLAISGVNIICKNTDEKGEAEEI